MKYKYTLIININNNRVLIYRSFLNPFWVPSQTAFRSASPPWPCRASPRAPPSRTTSTMAARWRLPACTYEWHF
ncbi:hypothetical protein mO260R [Vaccinia virus]|uniref:Uncharacterized protein n=2 Tax=Vaccinia virus TaxID=10245 RepID=Q49P95_VACC0|nr:hypothetical protein m8260R [Vaccinia virus]AAW23931.1 hypothetical protein mO260R [Vaccinia virus]